MTSAIVTLVNQASQTLEQVAPQIKEEANKKIGEIKQKIPSEESIKQIMMDEITSGGSESVCSPEMRNRLDSKLEKYKGKFDQLQNVSDKISEKLEKLKLLLDRVNKIISKIRKLFIILKSLINVLPTVITAAKVGINFLTGLAANGSLTVKLKDIIDKSKNKVEEYKNTIKVFEKRIDKILKATLIPNAILITATGVIGIIKNKINTAKGLVESYYLKHTLMCDVEGNSMEDEDFAAAVNEAIDNLNNGSSDGLNESGNGLNGSTIILIENDLLPSTIERIRNAKFKVIQYRIA